MMRLALLLYPPPKQGMTSNRNIHIVTSGTICSTPLAAEARQVYNNFQRRRPGSPGQWLSRVPGSLLEGDGMMIDRVKDLRREQRIYKKISRRLQKSLAKRRVLTLSNFDVLYTLRVRGKN